MSRLVRVDKEDLRLCHIDPMSSLFALQNPSGTVLFFEGEIEAAIQRLFYIFYSKYGLGPKSVDELVDPFCVLNFFHFCRFG